MSAPDLPRVEVGSRAELRRWLEANHAQDGAIRLVTWKKHVAERHVPWDDVVEEAPDMATQPCLSSFRIDGADPASRRPSPWVSSRVEWIGGGSGDVRAVRRCSAYGKPGSQGVCAAARSVAVRSAIVWKWPPLLGCRQVKS